MLTRSIALLSVLVASSLASAEPRTTPAGPSRTEPGATTTYKIPAEVTLRVFSVNANTLGCSPYVSLPCEGLERYRQAQTTAHLALQDQQTGLGPVVMFQAASRPGDNFLASQSIAAAGLKKTLGKTWVMGGVGVAAKRDRGRPPKSIPIQDTLSSPRLALAGGAGIDVDAGFDEPTSLALEGGRTIDSDPSGRIYQVTASLVQQF